MRCHKLKESLQAYLMRHMHYRMMQESLQAYLMHHKMFRMMQQPLPQPLCSNPLNLKVP
jgi:hypothetical protein